MLNREENLTAILKVTEKKSYSALMWQLCHNNFRAYSVEYSVFLIVCVLFKFILLVIRKN